MRQPMTRETRVTWIVVGMCLLAMSVRLLRVLLGDSPTPLAGLASSLYAAVILLWGISINQRIINFAARRYLLVSVWIMLFWMLISTMRNLFFFNIHSIRRILWYAFYIPMLTLPVLMFLSAMNIGRHESDPPNPSWRWLFAPAILLMVLILTNDFHHLFFVFVEDTAHSLDYAYGFAYLVPALFIATLYFTSLGVIYRRSKTTGTYNRFLLPAIITVVGLAYAVWNFTDHFNMVNSWLQLPEVYCFTFIAVGESCIRTGLIRSNRFYREFFTASSVSAQIIDTDDQVKYAADNAIKLSPGQIEAVKLSPVQIDEHTWLHSSKIVAGRVLWTDDVSNIAAINEQLSLVRKALVQENDLIQAENALGAERARLAESDRIADKITSLVRPQLVRVDQELAGLNADAADFRNRIARVCVLTSYIKRRRNLALLAESSSIIAGQELANSLRESLEYLQLLGVDNALRWHVDQDLPAEVAMLCYDCYQNFIETALPDLSSALVNLRISEGKVSLILDLAQPTGLISQYWRVPELHACNAQLMVNYSDEQCRAELRAKIPIGLKYVDPSTAGVGYLGQELLNDASIKLLRSAALGELNKFPEEEQ